MTDEYTFLQLEKSMLNECIDLFIDTFSKEPWEDTYDSREQVAEFFDNYLSDSYFVGYVMKDREKIIALSVGAQKPWIKGMEYYIDQFCVDEKYQRIGIGSTFLRLIEKDIECKGMNGIILMTSRGFPSEEFYLKNGFTRLDDLVYLVK